jgi:hypothetical protein
MVHDVILRNLSDDLDDLKVRNPKKYREIEKKAERLESEASFAVSQSPVGVSRMERLR